MTCTLCPLHKTARTVCIDGTGSGHPALLFVGAGPDMADDRSGVAFSGTNGHLLRDMLEPLVFPWRATNAIRCATPFGREPHIDEAEACRTYLAAEIALTRPEAIVALGNGALKTLTNTSGVGKNRGKLIDMRVSLRKEIERAAPDYTIPKVLAAWAPAYAAKDLSRDPELRADIANAVQHIRKLRGEDMGDTVPWSESLPGTYSSDGPYTFAFDIETNAETYWKPSLKIHMVGFAVNVIDAHVWKNELWLAQQFISEFYMNGHTFVGHNAIGFDAPALKFAGDVEDTMLLSYAIDEEADSHSLQACVQRNLQLPPWKDDVTWKWEDYSHELHWEKAAQYNGRDTVYTLRLWNRLKERADDRAWRLYRAILKPTAITFERMHRRGIPLDPVALKEAQDSLDLAIEAARDTVLKAAEPYDFPDFNPNSYPQVGKLLFEKLGYTPERLTEGGAPSTDAETLQALRLKKDHPVLEALLTYREHTKLRGWITPDETNIGADGRTHPSYSISAKSDGTPSPRSGRSASYGFFAPQRVPRRADIRRIVGLPIESGRVLIIADLSQVEMRTMAFLSREPNMLAIYREGKYGGDMHNYVAGSIAKKFRGTEEWTDEDRSLAKPVGFGSLYGAEAFTLRAYLLNVYGILVSMSQAQTLRDDVFFAALPGLPSYYSKVIADCKRDGFVLSPLGRRRKLPNIHSYDAALREEAARQAINSPNQAMGSDILLFGMNQIEQTVPQVQVIANMHDAVMLEANESDVDDDLLARIRECLEDYPVWAMKNWFDVDFDVPIKADIKVSRRWEK
jgi:uracil-DNA glycosylase family 4